MYTTSLLQTFRICLIWVWNVVGDTKLTSFLNYNIFRESKQLFSCVFLRPIKIWVWMSSFHYVPLKNRDERWVCVIQIVLTFAETITLTFDTKKWFISFVLIHYLLAMLVFRSGHVSIFIFIFNFSLLVFWFGGFSLWNFKVFPGRKRILIYITFTTDFLQQKYIIFNYIK